jgi:hypothetical protein
MHFFHRPSVPLVGTLCALYVSTLTRGLSPIEVPGVDFHSKLDPQSPKRLPEQCPERAPRKSPKRCLNLGDLKEAPLLECLFVPLLVSPFWTQGVDLCGGWDIIAKAIRDGRKRGPRDNPSYNISIFFFCYLPVIQSVSFPYEFLPVVRGRYCLFTAAPNSP